MELPWRKYNKIKERKSELKEELREVKEQRDRYQEQFKSEKERRSKLSAQKQEAEEKLNKLQDKLETANISNKTEKTEKTQLKDIKLSVEQTKNILDKLSTISSHKKDLVSVYSTGGVEDLKDFKGFKNTLSSQKISQITSERTQIFFTDEKAFDITLRTRPFFSDSWSLDNSFNVKKVDEFIQEKKHWALVSAGETTILSEKAGNTEKIDEVNTRVENKQKKGGYSQDRFERKRQEQIQQHEDKVEEKLEDLTNLKLLGNKKICKELPGEYLGGFDSSRNKDAQTLYKFRLRKTKPKT
ncbi:MAG: hypothetical protein J07AB43_08640 [Candidatus Nanosalina sp. J07AB43]|nr:MAG: hypothetical protein J07AB43_08640 [Candidatus Nanosalina sp. J07AB43]